MKTPKLLGDRPLPASQWHEGEGDVLWWCWRDGAWLTEAPYVGSPLDLGYVIEIRTSDKPYEATRRVIAGWPGYHTHWTRLPPQPTAPIARKKRMADHD